MLSRINPSKTTSWNQLTDHQKKLQHVDIQHFFKQNPSRFSEYSIQHEDILFDFSKNRLNTETLSLLFGLALECNLSNSIEHLFSGSNINETEKRAVLHTALRNRSEQPVLVDGKNIMQDIAIVLEQMRNFCNKIHSGNWRGYNGKKIKYIVNIGIGGSDLGPVMVTEALKPYQDKGIAPFFVSNVDGTHLVETLKKINPEETLFLIASKTFTTQETMTNAFSARKWMMENGVPENEIAKHFIALSTNRDAVSAFGIDPENMFEFWDWVGGRYSLWSAIGLSIALSIGFDRFEELLSGAFSADKHFRQTPLEKNIPVIMALIGIWHRNFWNYESEAILPYDQYLHRFPAYFQQGNMESNGKYIDRSGDKVNYATGPIIWGEPGTNGQHAFYQLLHQGTSIIPCDFIVSAQSHNPIGDHHEKLVSNCFAQSEAMMKGTNHENPFRVFEGNRPSNTFVLKKLTPYTLGSIIAFYEHKIFVQGIIWNIYSFDQWGVELGKILANTILPELKDDQEITTHDSSTNGLINHFKRMRK